MATQKTSTTITSSDSSNWEPRVTRVEAGLDGLKNTVQDLASVVRTQGEQQMAQNTRIESQIQSLTVAVTNAAAPKKTDWNLLLTLGFFILTCSGILFIPLNQTTQATKESLHEVIMSFQAHQQLDNHPVGVALMHRLQSQLDTSIANMAHDQEVQNADWNRRFNIHDDMDKAEFTSLEGKLKTEYMLANKTLEQRILIVEGRQKFQDEQDLKELREWRNKASGLSVPDMSIPLQPREVRLPAK